MTATGAEFSACPCSGRTLERFIRPALLTVLAGGDLYGYRLVQRLAEMPIFGGQKPNATGVYRALKAMADEGLVVSSWEFSESGPAKRLYTITGKGLGCLMSWMTTLDDYRRAIDGLLDAGRAVLADRGITEGCCCCE